MDKRLHAFEVLCGIVIICGVLALIYVLTAEPPPLVRYYRCAPPPSPDEVRDVRPLPRARWM